MEHDGINNILNPDYINIDIYCKEEKVEFLTDIQPTVISIGKTGATFIFSESKLKDLLTLIDRGLNTWDTAPVHLKEFADILKYGCALQDYRSQDSSKKSH